jgi:alanine racemase
VKADAYGHGAFHVARELDNLGAEMFAVATIDEAVELRGHGIEKPILVLGYTPEPLLEELINYRLTQAVFSFEYASLLSRTACQNNAKITVHIKVDTGMSRMGFIWQDVKKNAYTVDNIVKTCRLPGLVPEGIFTHFACSDEIDNNFTAVQFKRFSTLLVDLEGSNVKFGIRHCCNSGAIINYPQMHLDMVRPGIMLYGAQPGTGLCRRPDLRPVMRLISTVTQVRNITPGQTVSYGQIFRAERPTTVATVAIGYADGFHRVLSNRAEMMIEGQRVPVIGRVCMDQTMLDVTDIPEVHIGQQVTVFGSREGERPITAEEYAENAGTIPYESLCSVSKRIPRVYTRDGKKLEENQL